MRSEIQKLGSTARGTLYVQLANFPNHYLVLVITDEQFRYALISVDVISESMYGNMVMRDIGWLDVHRIHGENVVVSPQPDFPEGNSTGKQKRATEREPDLNVRQTGSTECVVNYSFVSPC
jgi:hypothetical protein